MLVGVRWREFSGTNGCLDSYREQSRREADTLASSDLSHSRAARRAIYSIKKQTFLESDNWHGRAQVVDCVWLIHRVNACMLGELDGSLQIIFKELLELSDAHYFRIDSEFCQFVLHRCRL
jgi:hypothetical protein